MFSAKREVFNRRVRMKRVSSAWRTLFTKVFPFMVAAVAVVSVAVILVVVSKAFYRFPWHHLAC